MSHRIDQNHEEIVRALRDHPGVRLFSTAALGKGVPDICVGYRSFNILCEIKGPKGRLNPVQTEWHFQWTGTPVVILRTVDDVVLLLKTLDTYYKELGHTIAEVLTEEDHDRSSRTDKS
jgi:hypothetical protein